MTQWVLLLSRALMAYIFLHGGVAKAMAPTATMAMMKFSQPMRGAAYAVTLVVELAVAAAFLIGWRARWSALILAAWCVVTALVAHNHPEDRGQMIHFAKNLAMAGGFLQVYVYGAGRFSVDRG